MKFKEQIERIEKLNKLIQVERTGPPQVLASKLGVQRSTLYEYLEYLKSLGLKISYDRTNCTFFYSSNHKLELHFSLKVTLLSESEHDQIRGGFQSFLFPSIFYGSSKTILPV